MRFAISQTFPAEALLLPATLASLLKLLEKPSRAWTFKRAHHMALSLFFVEFDCISLALESGGLRPFAAQPARVHFSGIHIDAQF
jgi:hypothetical protein